MRKPSFPQPSVLSISGVSSPRAPRGRPGALGRPARGGAAARSERAGRTASTLNTLKYGPGQNKFQRDPRARAFSWRIQGSLPWASDLLPVMTMPWDATRGGERGGGVRVREEKTIAACSLGKKRCRPDSLEGAGKRPRGRPVAPHPPRPAMLTWYIIKASTVGISPSQQVK